MTPVPDSILAMGSSYGEMSNSLDPRMQVSCPEKIQKGNFFCFIFPQKSQFF